MNELLVHCNQDEIVDAIQEFLIFEDLDCTLRRIASLDELGAIEEAQGLVLQDETSNRKVLEMARLVREGSVHCAMPLLVMLHDLDPYLKTICFDLEYVLPCSFPANSADLVPGLKKIIFFSRKKQTALQLREQIAMLFRQGSYKESLAVIAQYAEDGKDAFRGHLLKAKALMALRQFKAAAESALAAVHENRNSLEARITLASIYQEAGLAEKSYEVLNKSVAMAPKHPKFLTIMGHMSLDAGNFEEAVHKFEASLNLDQFQEEARAGLIVADILVGKLKDAKEKVRLISNQKSAARYAQTRVIQLAKARRYEEARKLFDTILKLIPNQKDGHRIWLNLGLQAKKDGDLVQAEKFLQASQALAPKDFTKAQDLLNELKVS